MTVGYFAPLPPVRSGVADYAAALLGALPPDQVRVGADGDVNLYHVGNNELHREIVARSVARPGVVLLHDAVLHHFYLGALSREEYIEEFVYNYGGWYRGMAEELWAGRSRSAGNEIYFRWPMLKRVASTARAVIVHNEAAAGLVRSAAPGVTVEVIPHLPLPFAGIDAVSVERWRASLGILPSHTLFGVAGYLRESKRVLPVIRAFHRVRRLRDDVHLLLAGSASGDLERSLEGQRGFLREPHLPEAQFQERLAACDVGINLRYPSAAESSGITTRWLQMGRPVLVSEALENAGLPLGCCPRVPVGLAEEDGLVALMLWLADSGARRHHAGLVARTYVESTLDLGQIGRRVWQVLELSSRSLAAHSR